MKRVLLIALAVMSTLTACTRPNEDRCFRGELVTVHYDLAGSPPPMSYKLDANRQIQKC